MPLEVLDSRVHIIVTLRKRGVSDDDINSVTALYDSVEPPLQTMIAKLVTLEDPQVVAALVRLLPDVRAALLKRDSKAVVAIVEQAAKAFQPA
jgi:hypothetical protein